MDSISKISNPSSEDCYRDFKFPKVNPKTVPFEKYIKWLGIIISIMLILGFICSLYPPVHKVNKKLKDGSNNNSTVLDPTINLATSMHSATKISNIIDKKLSQYFMNDPELEKVNVVYSSASIFMALSMLYEGSSGMLASDFQSNLFFLSDMNEERQMVMQLTESLVGAPKNNQNSKIF